MCSSPKIPGPPPPEQEVKQPEMAVRSKRKGNTLSGGTLLTSPSGVTQSALNTGAPTLLGG